MERRIGLMGGAFNPVHNGHLLVANEVLNHLHLDKIIFIPSYQPPKIENKHISISSQDRYNMLKLATKDNPKFQVSKIELNQHRISYTYKTLVQLEKIAPKNKYYLILGADEINCFSQWYQAKKVAQKVHIVSVDRNHHFGRTNVIPVIQVHVPTFDVSSTLIRNRIKNNQSIRYLLPNAVIRYINQKKLYQK